ncbi:MAG: ATP-binding protein [Bacteroidota bacterium]
MELADLRRLVRQGEHMHLEFKRKAHHPDKIARELVAFANSEGGQLLVGVDDNQTIYGVKFPQEDAYVLNRYFDENIVPKLDYELERVSITAQRQVLVYTIPSSERKPLYLKETEGPRKKTAFIRYGDMSLTASREMLELLRMQKRERGVNLRFGELEQRLLQYLEESPRITLDETRQLLQLPRRKASIILILLVRAGLLHIQPTEKGDYFSLAEEAFQ